MSTDYSPGIVVGFLVNVKQFLKPLAVELPEESHLEDRYDPVTGKKLKPIKVVDKESGTYYRYKGVTYEDLNCFMYSDDPLLNELVKDLDCEITAWGDFRDGDIDFMQFAIEPSKCKLDSEGLTSNDVQKALKKLPTLERRLKRAGFKAGKPGVWAALSIA